jgi:recombinational DNA repair protein RecR
MGKKCDCCGEWVSGNTDDICEVCKQESRDY